MRGLMMILKRIMRYYKVINNFIELTFMINNLGNTRIHANARNIRAFQVYGDMITVDENNEKNQELRNNVIDDESVDSDSDSDSDSDFDSDFDSDEGEGWFLQKKDWTEYILNSLGILLN
jgi:hypothetical protein